MGQGLESVLIADLGNGSIGLAEVVEDALFAALLHPFIDGLMEHGIEDAAEGGGGIASQLGKVFYSLYLQMVLQHKILETVCVLGKRMYQHGQLIIRVAMRKDEGELFLLERKQLFADFPLRQVGLGGFQEELQLLTNLKGSEYQGWGHFLGYVLIPAFTEEFGLGELITDTFHIRHGEYFIL